MVIEESLWIKEKLAKLGLNEENTILNIGSGTADYRQRVQPHIEQNVISPLKEKKIGIFHLDQKTGEGVDFVGDIENPGLINKINRRFSLVICTNMLEHVSDIQIAIRNIISFVSDQGYLLITAPLKYPKHKDPIDNLCRFSVNDLKNLIAENVKFDVISSENLDVRSSIYYFSKSKYPFWGYRKFHFWRYFFKPLRWKISCLLVKINK